MDKQVILIIEPHADDAYLSMHQHIADWKKAGKLVIIGTVFSATRKRARDAANYADAMGVTSCGYDFEEGKPLDRQFDSLPGNLGMLYGLGDVSIVGPLGIQHPEHKAVREWINHGLATLPTIPPEFCYVEIPYYTKQKNQDEVNSLLCGLKMVSLKKPKHYKADEKYWKCFKDQSAFFHFNPAEVFKDIPEMIVSN